MQSEEKPVMATGLERIAAKARSEPKPVYIIGTMKMYGNRT